MTRPPSNPPALGSEKSFRANPQEKGLTLIEVVVVILVMGIIMGVAAINLLDTKRGDLRRDALMLANQMRDARHQALLSGRVLRFEFDLESGGLQLSALPPGTPVELSATKDEDDEEEEEDDNEVNFETLMADVALLAEEDAGLEPSPLQLLQAFGGGGSSVLSAYDVEPEITPVQFSAGTTIKAVWTDALEEMAEDGTVAQYFFPHGQSQSSIIVLGILDDPDDTTFSLLVDGGTGRTEVRPGLVEAP